MSKTTKAKEKDEEFQFSVGKCSFCHNNGKIKFTPMFGIYYATDYLLISFGDV